VIILARILYINPVLGDRVPAEPATG